MRKAAARTDLFDFYEARVKVCLAIEALLSRMTRSSRVDFLFLVDFGRRCSYTPRGEQHTRAN